MSDLNKKINAINKHSNQHHNLKMVNNGINKSPKNDMSKKILRIILLILIILLIIVIIYIIFFYIKYMLTDCYEKKNLSDYLASYDINNVCLYKYKPASKKQREYKDENEVYNISNQDFTYEQAKCKCGAYNGRLAKKDEIIAAYNKGATWCNYGWSDGQDAYFPVQKCEWDKRQAHEKTKNTCGLNPGINGGHFPNPELKFGANCYGIRPKGKLVIEKKAYCEPKNICKIHRNKFSNHIKDSDEITPFNNKQWSQYIK